MEKSRELAVEMQRSKNTIYKLEQQVEVLKRDLEAWAYTRPHLSST
jgi:hypothetical protein